VIKNLFKKIRIKLNYYPSIIKFRGIKFSNVNKSTLLKEIYLTDFYEYEIVKFFDYFNYTNFIDVGSNIGFFSLFVKKYKNWNVESFEPYFRSFEFAQKLMKLNNLNYKLNNEAISCSNGTSKIYVPNSKKRSPFSGCASLIKPDQVMRKLYGRQTCDVLNVKTKSFNELIHKNHNKNTLIKMDIEGVEFDTLSSVKNLRKIKEVDLILEISLHDNKRYKLFNLLKSSGFRSYLMTNIGLILEDRPLTLPKYDVLLDSKKHAHRTVWRNHFFTKKSHKMIVEKNFEIFGHNI